MTGRDASNIVAVAELMIERFGDDAVGRIEERAERYRREGDRQGAEYWRKVAWVIRDMKAH